MTRRIAPGRQSQGTARGHGLKGVRRQVAEDLQQGRRGHRHLWQIGIEVDLDPNAFGFGGPGREPGGFGQHGIQIAGSQVLAVGA